MKKKKPFKQKLKEYFTEKPNDSFWKHAFITLFFFRWVAPTVLRFYTFLQLGLVAPDVDFTPMAEKASATMATGFANSMQRMFEIGQGIAIDNPLVAKILFYAMGYFVWVIWAGMIFLLINLSRYLIGWVYRKMNKK